MPPASEAGRALPGLLLYAALAATLGGIHTKLQLNELLLQAGLALLLLVSLAIGGRATRVFTRRELAPILSAGAALLVVGHVVAAALCLPLGHGRCLARALPLAAFIVVSTPLVRAGGLGQAAAVGSQALSAVSATALGGPEQGTMAHHYEGLAYFPRGERALARRALEEAVRLDPGLQAARRELERLLAGPAGS